MADEERQDEQQPETPEEAAPPDEQEAPAEEQGETAAEETPAEEPAAEEPPAEEPAAEEAPAEEPAAEEAPAAEQEAEAPADEEPPEAPDQPSKESKEKDAPPGAELEPIAIESERPLDAEERARREAEAEERAQREAVATDEAGEEPGPQREPTVALEGDVRVRATGKRKSSIARVMLVPGSGRFVVNRRELDEYFPRPAHQTIARQALVTSGYEGNIDVQVRVHGGGVSGQAGAVRHGVARALCEIDPDLRGELKRRGLLTRDARSKERRKAGLKKARKRPQFSKR
jgi:small subunit ribosomal protein S9